MGNVSSSVFNMKCQHCGSIIAYADDSTFTITDSDPAQLTEKLTQKFEIMVDYLTANKLKVNSEKTHLIVMCTDQRRRRHSTETTIRTGSVSIYASNSERLLGAYIHQNMKWAEHIQNSKFSVIQSLNVRLGALKTFAKFASFKVRLLLANGIFMSKLIFMIPLWGGCAEYLLNALQVCQNNAARAVTRHDRTVPVHQLLRECGWRSVRQEVFYYTVMQVHKILLQKSPKYLYSQLTADGSHTYMTRNSSSCSVRRGKSFHTNLSLCRDSFKWRGIMSYESIPVEIRNIEDMKSFKKRLDSWIKSNIPL